MPTLAKRCCQIVTIALAEKQIAAHKKARREPGFCWSKVPDQNRTFKAVDKP